MNLMQTRAIVLAVFATSALAMQTAHAQAQTDAPMTFFVTSTTHSGDLGSLAGADAECQNLAAAAERSKPAQRWLFLLESDRFIGRSGKPR